MPICQHAFGDVGAFDEDAEHLACLVLQWLVDEIEVAQLGAQLERDGLPVDGDAARIGFVETFKITLAGKFRQHIARGASGPVSVADQLFVGGVEQVEAMLGPAHQRHEPRSLFEHCVQPLALTPDMSLGAHFRGGLDDDGDDADNVAAVVETGE